jgi:hypothetical protein
MKKKRRDSEGLSLSFLDCICCGFGAMILLLMVVKVRQPEVFAENRENLSARVAALREELAQLASERQALERTRESAAARGTPEQQRNQELRVQLEAVETALRAARAGGEAPEVREARLLEAKQKLSDEMKRLYGADAARSRPDAPIGGIPVDSEYVIFVIDTSGSMFNFAWTDVNEKVSEALEVYPRVEGIQVLNDEGGYMFPRYAGRWIPDTPSQRKAILDTLITWRPFSNSSPVEGIETAINTFYKPGRKISIYVFGDDYSGDSLASVVKEVDRLNRDAGDGERLVRIHAVGFPVQYMKDQVTRSGYRFAHLMRVLCERNGGAFVGLTRLNRGPIQLSPR